jgi:hypothetical protein
LLPAEKIKVQTVLKSKIKKRFFIVLIAIACIALAGYIFRRPAYAYLTAYLSKSEQVSANVLVVEGWLPEYAIESVKNEFLKNKYEYIITTGIKSTDYYYMLSMNGYLIFYPGKLFKSYTDQRVHQVDIAAYSELGGRNRAHFNVFVNDSMISQFTANRKKHEYSFSWSGALADIDSIMVQFDNDEVGDFGDRNLYIDEVKVDQQLAIPYLKHSAYNISEFGINRRIVNDFNSNAQLTRNRLISAGIDSSAILSIPANPTAINRTLASALAVRDWLKRSDLKVKGINIMSEGTHARRTWLTYSQILGKSTSVGIIALNDFSNMWYHKNHLFYVSRQTLALVYYWFILQFYRA